MTDNENHIKLLGLVTIYRSEPSVTAANILRYIQNVDFLIIWDNSPLEDQLEGQILAQLGTYRTKVIWKGDGQNYYIAPAINSAWHYAQEHKYDLLLLMDQDSQWDDFHAFRSHVETLYQSSPDYVFCPYVIGDDYFDIVKDVQEKRIFINSGTIIPTAILNKIDGADEAFPLDALDHDLAIRIQKAGYTIVCLTKHKLRHTVGAALFMGPFHIYTDNYSPQRVYSVSKCHIIKYRKHKDWLTFSENKETFKQHYLLKFIRIILAEPQKAKRLKSLFKGIYDGITYDMKIVKQ